MNERIRELGEQAMSATFNKFNGVEWSAEEWRNFYDTKFAELIVKECLLCCEQVISDPVPKSVDTFEQGGIHCMDEIKQHFGVEE